MKKKPIGKLMFFGLGGHSIYLHNKGETLGEYSTLSGYENPETFKQRYDAGDYEKYDLDGAYVIDKREILTKSPMLSVKAPLCRPDLEPGQVIKFNRDDVSETMLNGLEGMFKTLATLAVAGISSFDYVDPVKYTAWWKQNGAKIGIFKDGVINWEPEKVKPPAHEQTQLF